MTTTVMRAQTATESEQTLSALQTYALRRTHPRSIFIDMVGITWFTYFLWHHDWKSALGAVIISRTLALLFTMNINVDKFAETMLGKLAILHLNPINLIIQIGGVIILLPAIWQHSVEISLLGLSIVFLGHLAGWSKVDSRLADKSA